MTCISSTVDVVFGHPSIMSLLYIQGSSMICKVSLIFLLSSSLLCPAHLSLYPLLSLTIHPCFSAPVCHLYRIHHVQPYILVLLRCGATHATRSGSLPWYWYHKSLERVEHHFLPKDMNTNFVICWWWRTLFERMTVEVGPKRPTGAQVNWDRVSWKVWAYYSDIQNRNVSLWDKEWLCADQQWPLSLKG